MYRRAGISLVAFCAAAALSTAVGPPSAAAAEQAAPGRAPQTVLVDCLWNPEVRPSDFMLACGDGNSRLASLKWTQWGTEAARAEGVNWVNDCTPYCAAGRFHGYPVKVLLDQPQSWKKQPGTTHYARITLVYPDDRPAGYGQTMSYPLWD
ncbi:hypothetical protein ACIPSE_24220 [Streptomyces sp. NPDC090106]|uniref:hypothetical protein n=1 Tax=Streptomyces sp. NPDC090106 TaxID=3365946 RepID=UPI00380742E8